VDLRNSGTKSFHEATCFSSKDIEANTLHFEPIFDPFPLPQIVGRTSDPDVLCTSKPRSFSSACINFRVQHSLRAQIWFSEKIDLGGSRVTYQT